MKTQTASKIIEYIGLNTQITPKALALHLGISSQALFRQLAKLQKNNLIYKIGSPPKVFYRLTTKLTPASKIKVDLATKRIIDKNYLVITPSGERKNGFEAFTYWCNKTAQPVEKTAREYVQTLAKYNRFKRNGIINGTKKLKGTFKKTYLDRLFYLNFYSIERFGKTKLGELLLYAKQSQNPRLIKEIVDQIRPDVEQVVKKWNIDGVGFIPPTVKREVQFMKELERNLNISTQTVSIIKLKTEVSVPQKTLTKLADRIENARETIVVTASNKFENILLLDDAVGSGATMNETAAQIRAKKICKGKIIGLAITGSFKGFDVISEV